MRDHPIAFGRFVLDPDSGTLSRDGEAVAIGQRAASLLETLASTPGRVRTKAELIDAAWPGLAIEESNLSVQIAALRKLLGNGPTGGEWIETVPRVGYRFVAGSGRVAAPLAAAAADEPPIPSLAVLPFHNLGDDPGQDYFADGVVEDIITALSRFRTFAVVARNSSFVYKGRVADVRQVGEELGVRYVLEGSVRRAGDRLRIGAQLVDAASGSNLWAHTFDGAPGDIFAFQDGITEAVAMMVEPYVQAAEIERARRKRAGSIAAYDLYLRAMPLLHAETEEGCREAHALLSQALAIEPDNPVFLAHAAWALSHSVVMGWRSPDPDAVRKSVELARRTLAHAREDAMALASAAMTLLHSAKDYELGMAAVETAASLNPNHAAVIFRAGIASLHCGSIEEALGYFHRNIRLSPRDPAAYATLTGIAHAEMIRGNYAEAVSWATRSLAVNANYPATWWMVISGNAQLGRMDEARRLLAAFKQLVPDASITRIWAGQPQKDPSRLAAILDGLRQAGLEEG